jgi:hypothetical protein
MSAASSGRSLRAERAAGTRRGCRGVPFRLLKQEWRVPIGRNGKAI